MNAFLSLLLRVALRRLLPGLFVWTLAFAPGAQQLAPSYPTDMCAGDRNGGNLGCTANDVQITNIQIHQGSGAPSSCVGGSSLNLDLDVTVNFGSATRYDVGIFLSQDGRSPQNVSTRTSASGTGSASCRVAVLPTPLFPSLDGGPFTVNGQTVYDTCGDGSKATVGGGTGTTTFTITGVTVKCQSIDSSGSLNIPFVVTWDNQASPSGAICTSNANPSASTGSKCNAPSGNQGNVSVVTLPSIAKTNPASSISPGDTTTYTVTISNTTGITLTNVIFKDPAVANLNISSVACSAQSASCPTTGSTTVAYMQGSSGITIPQMLAGGTETFTIKGQLTGNPTGTLTNQASASIGTAATTASVSGTIVYPGLVNSKTVTLLNDPVNGTTNPRNIPGSESLYSIAVTNTGLGRVDAGTVIVTDPIPANTILYVGNLAGAGSGPVNFIDSGSGLTFSYPTDLEFFGNGAWGYTPVPDASGYDSNVKSIRVKPKGRMYAWSGTGAYPGFTLQFKVKVQ